MDSAVVAALVAVPTAVLAAGAAYAAGRRQARGTHAGAVDAVRRPAQREAYLALSAEARKFLGRAQRQANRLGLMTARPDLFAPGRESDRLRELAIRDIAAVQEFVAVDNALNGVVQEGSTDVIHAAQHLHRALARMAVDALLEMTDILSGTMDEATWLQAADSRLSDAYRDLNTYQAAINRHLNRLL